MDARALVRTMLRPHDGKHAEFSDIRLPTQDLKNLLVLVFDQIVLCQQFFNVSSVRLHKSLHITATALFSQDLDLRALRGDKGTLDSAATCQPLRQRASMLISTNGHFLDQRVMPAIECLELAAPTQGLRMTRIAFFAVYQHRPDRVELPVLAEQMIPAQPLRRNIPDAHPPFVFLALTDADLEAFFTRTDPAAPRRGFLPSALSRIPTPGGVRGRAMIDDRTRSQT